MIAHRKIHRRSPESQLAFEAAWLSEGDGNRLTAFLHTLAIELRRIALSAQRAKDCKRACALHMVAVAIESAARLARDV